MSEPEQTNTGPATSVAVSHPLLGADEDSSSEEFDLERPPPEEAQDGSEDEFVYPQQSDSQPVVSQAQPSPAQLEALNAAASAGELAQLQRLVKTYLEGSDIPAFSLANDTSSRTGYAALHAAASRGHRDVVAWLIEDCGAIADLEDREGETALHKASLNGHFDVVEYLVPHNADVHVKDADGWTALHNAASKGYLDIVKYLCEKGDACAAVDGVRGVDVRSKDGYTALMNAASKGHLPIVLYLLNKQNANPLIRNKWGETAFDVAAAVFEVWICEILQNAEKERWRTVPTPYNPLLIHTTIPLILYENQRLDTRLKTVAVEGRPKFSSSALKSHARRKAHFELKLPVPDEETGQQLLPAWKSQVQLPLRESPWVLPRPSSQDSPAAENAERSHYWQSEWELDITHPGVDAQDGWQYAQSFEDPDDKWTAEKPPMLDRILNNSGIVSTSFGGPSSRSSRAASSSQSRMLHSWVRRRRWVRIMRRRLDIPPLPLLEPDGSMYHLDLDGSLIPYSEGTTSTQTVDDEETGGQELGAMSTTFLSSARDYVTRARYLVGKQSQDSAGAQTPVSAQEARRAIAKLERATSELREGILRDDDPERKLQADVLLNAYNRELERRRLAAGSRGFLVTTDEDLVDGQEDEDDTDGDSFQYPRASSSQGFNSPSSSDYFSRPGVARAPADLTPQLTQAPDFRVPTSEAPQKVRWTSNTNQRAHMHWERDESVSACRNCQRRFNFLNRRHHCRKCGRIFCDRCSSYRAILDPADVIHDPYSSEVPPAGTSSRVCQACFEDATSDVPSRFSNLSALERIVVDQERLTVPGALTRRQTSSQLSDLADCPVCNQNLDEIGDAPEQEAHVRNCLEGGAQASSSIQSGKYLVYRLPAGSPLLGEECVICLEEFVKGSTVARLSCFCSFHNACFSSWLSRGKSCPVHAR